MTIEEARMVWLLKLGSGWINCEDVTRTMRAATDSMAFATLFNAQLLNYDLNTYRVKIKCK